MAPANPGTRKNADRLHASSEVPAVVGIGASADRLDALRAFFAGMPRSPGLAFIIATRVGSNHESLTLERLAASTALAIESASDQQPLVGNHVYVVPPDHTLTIENGRLRVHRPTDRRALRGTIDRLFRSLATDQGAHAAAVVLSGTEAECASGLRAVKAAGGLVLVDSVLEPGKMPEALMAHVRSGRAGESAALARADRQLLERGAAAAFVVRPSGEIVRFHGSARRHLVRPHGPATLDVRTLLRPALKPIVRQAFHDALRTQRKVVVKTLGNRRRGPLRVTIEPTRGSPADRRLWLVIFEQLAPAPPSARPRTTSPRTMVRRLKAELRAAKKAQESLIDQLEAGDHPLLDAGGATVLADRELRVRRFTAAASRLFQLQPSDTGRPLDHIASALVDVDLQAMARTVLEGAAPLVRDVISKEGGDYILRILPSLDASASVQGVVLTLVDVSDLKRTERELRAAHEETSLDLRRMRRLHEVTTRLAGHGDLQEAFQEILRAATEITGAEMGCIHLFDGSDLPVAAQIGLPCAFLDFFARAGADVASASRAAMMTGERVTIEDLADSRLFAASPALPVLLDAGVRAMQSTPLFDRSGTFLGTLSTHFRAPRLFDQGEQRWLDQLARVAADVIHRRQSDAMASLATDVLEQRVADRTKWLALMHQVTGAVNDAASWHEGLRVALERICETERWQAGYVYLPDRADADALVPSIGHLRDQHLRPFHLLVQQCRVRREDILPGVAFDDGRPRWVNGKEEVLRRLPIRGEAVERANLQAVVTLPVRSGRDVIAVLQLFSTEPHAPDELLSNLMNDISAQIGKLLERERSSAEMADMVWREQQGLVHNLHDSLGQTLTGLGMLAAGLRRQAPAAAGKSATQIGQLAQQAIAQVRQFARGLFPFEINAKGLVPALRELASTTEMFHPIHVTVESGGGAVISDGRVATQLYRIAQEAVTNAVKHAQADSIKIDLHSGSDLTRLQVTDDGVGITGRASQRDGLGLRIMMSRAVSIGATLSVEPAAKRGTTVSCTLRHPASPINPLTNSPPNRK